MPKSKHRMKPPVSKQTLIKVELTERAKKARREIYERALPNRQPYPPMAPVEGSPERTALSYQGLGSRAIRLAQPSEMSIGGTVELSGGAVYEKQRDGSLKRVREVKEERRKAA